VPICLFLLLLSLETKTKNRVTVQHEERAPIWGHPPVQAAPPAPPPPNNNKRKPTVPVKRNHHSVKENMTASTTTESNPNTSGAVEDISTSDPQSSKRVRVSQQPESADATATSTSGNGVPHDGSGAVAGKGSSMSKGAAANSASGRSSSSAASTHSADSSMISSKQQRSPLQPTSRKSVAVSSPFSNSRNADHHSRDTSSRPTTAKANIVKVVTNNTKIHDFFNPILKTGTKKGQKISSSTAKAANASATSEAAAIAGVVAPAVTSKHLHETTEQPMTETAAPRQSSQKPAQGSNEQQLEQLEVLRLQCQELQRVCSDKDEQLKAIRDNRTIVQSALKSTLQRREQELITAQAASAQREAETRRILEELVRTDACQEARELRETLAANGARLGRIVPVPGRSLMHRTVLEQWEDGHASKELLRKMRDLSQKRAVLEERQQAAVAAEERVLQSSDEQIHGDITVPAVVGGLTIRTQLEVREAVESVRLHLSNVRRREKELALEEQNLQDEKGAHIRALKRVASEDASRFRHRPLLHDRYVLQALLGKGGFSEVWRAFDLEQLKEVAVKIHQLDSRWADAKKENYTKHVSREYEIHRNVRHPRIVSLYDVFEIDTNSFATVLECCDGTDLDTLLKTRRRLPERDARAILLQILSGMDYLSHSDGERQGIIHYDLKPGNILFDEYGDAKITDFGLSKIVDTQDSGASMELTSQGAGTYWYLPPECFLTDENVRISSKVDVWSIGVIFYQMLYGKRPFGDGQSQDKILADGTMLNAHEVLFPDKPLISASGKEFIRACLTYEQTFRPSIAQICQHSYVLQSSLDCDDASSPTISHID
jgi:tousled-like kinase